jgi:hypothetical protein
VVIPDQYLLVASNPQYLEDQRQITLLPGKANQLRVHLYTEAELTRYRRRWDFWWPVAVTAAGGAVALGGGGFMWAARGDYDASDRVIKQQCPAGCSSEPPDARDRRKRAATFDALGTGLLIGGGVSLVTGAVLVFINRAEAYRISPADIERESTAISVLPWLSKEVAGLALQRAF